MTKEELMESMGLLFSYFNEKPNKAKVTIYWAIFKDFNADDFKGAIIRYMGESTNKFFPMPADIKGCLEIADKMTPEEAWMHCKEIVNNNWPDDPWRGISDPIMLRAARAIGFDGFDLTENLSFAKRDFIDNYTAIDKPEARERLGILNGEDNKQIDIFNDFSDILE